MPEKKPQTVHKLLTVRDVVEQTGFSENTVRRHIDKGALPVRRIGPAKRIRITSDDLDRYLDS